MDDDLFHQMMNHQHEEINFILHDQIFLCNDLPELQVRDKCNVAVFEKLQTYDLERESDFNIIQSDILEARKPLSSPVEQHDSDVENLDFEFGPLEDLFSSAIGETEENLIYDSEQDEDDDEEEYFDTFTDSSEDSCSENEDEYQMALEEKPLDICNLVIDQDDMQYFETCMFIADAVQPEDFQDEGLYRNLIMKMNEPKASEQNLGNFCSSIEDTLAPKTLEDASDDLSMMLNLSTTSEVCSHMAETSVSMSDPSSLRPLSHSADSVSESCIVQGSEDLSKELELDVDACANNVYNEFLFNGDDIGQEENIWSILTTNLCYLDANKSQNNDQLYTQPKETHFNADNNNIPYEKSATLNPLEVKNFKTNKNAAKLPISKSKDDSYDMDRLNISVDDNFEPDTHISSTYLWTYDSSFSDGPKVAKNGASWFPEGSFPMSLKGETTGFLLDGTPVKVNTLIDSGASKPMLNKKFYNRTPFLHNYPKFKIKPRGIKIASGQIMIFNECIAIMLNFGGHVFEIVAYLIDMTEKYDFVMGQKTMYELEGGPHFGDLSFHFMMRSIPLLATEKIFLTPGNSYTYNVQMVKTPPGFNGGMGSVKMKRNTVGGLVQTLKVNVSPKGLISLTAVNESNEVWRIHKGDKVGCIDMRSLGYFHVSRDTILMAVEDQCKFLNDEDSLEFFNLLVDDIKQINANTKLQPREPDKVRDTNLKDNTTGDPYPWLDKDDPRRTMTDEEIINKYVNLEDSDLTEKEKKQLRKVILRYRPAFSLRDEIGVCPHMEVDLELTDTTPFFIRPFPIKENEKDIIDKEMRKGCLLGILKKGMSSYSSPIMLIPRKQGGIPRIVTDFRHLNSRLVTLQPSIPLVRDAIQILGASGCEVISVIDLRDAYHTLRLSKRSQKFCGITPYYGSDTYLYQRLGMGLSVSPAVWQNFIQKVLSEIPNHRKHHLAIMDDCLVHSKKASHLHHLIDLFKAIIRNGLKISPKKCQLFRKKLVYMGHTLLIEDGIPKITPHKTRIDAIQKFDPPKTPKNCKQFCGMVNFLSIFLKELQIKLVPIYQLTKKGIPFVWTEECQKAFEDIKKALTSPPVLVMPNTTGKLVLVSDTSIIGCGATLYQEQNGKYRIIAYYSKKLPEAVRRYSISELELTGILANISAFKHILRNTEFTVYCDHSALVHIIDAKREPPTLRLQKLIENLMDYKFKIKFQKGKELYVTDFLSRHPDNDTDSPNEIIPIAFMMEEISKTLDPNDPKIKKLEKHKCFKCTDIACIMTRSQTAKANAVVPTMYPLKGDHQKPEISQKGIIKIPPKPIAPVAIAQGTQKQADKIEINNIPAQTDIQTNLPFIPPIQQPFSVKERESILKNFNFKPQVQHNIEQVAKPMHQTRMVQPIPLDVRLKGRLPAFDIELDTDTNKWEISEQDKNRKLKPLFNQNVNIVRRFLPKQLDLDKFIKELHHKVIHDYNIPISIKELRAEYPSSSFFGDIYKYKTRGICKNFGKGSFTFKSMCDNDYFVVEGLLFRTKYQSNPTAVLCIPEKYVPILLYQYHDEVLAGHPGVQKLMATISKKYFFPGMMNIIRNYVISCLECQSMKRKQEGMAIHYPRVPLNFRAMERFSMDIKHMPPSKLGFTKLLVCTCEQSNWIVGICLTNEQASTIAESLYYKIICQFGHPKTIICDEAPAFTSELMKTYFHALNIKPIYVSPSNHGSNRSERYIRTLSDIITKQLIECGEDWPMFVAPSCFAMNTQVSLVTKFSPYEMVYFKSPPDLFNFDFDPDTTGLNVDTEKYMKYMTQRRKQMIKLIYERKRVEAETQFIREMRKHPEEKPFRVGDLVFLNHSGGSLLNAPSKKFKRDWIGPLKIHTILDDTHYVLSDWDEKLISPKIHINRIKSYTLNLRELDKDGHLQIINNAKDLYEKWLDILNRDRELQKNI